MSKYPNPNPNPNPDQVHELHWSKYGSQYRSRAEEQRKCKLAEAHELQLEREARALLPPKVGVRVGARGRG